jgi:RNA polymerase sigma-54 factor
MELQLRQELRLTQQLIMTPQLQMAIKLLQLNRIELVDRIHQELEENPALEEVRESAADESSGEKVETLPAESLPDKELSIEEKVYNDIDWSSYFEEYDSRGRSSFETEAKDAPRDMKTPLRAKNPCL